jgi:Ca2+-transporting ATPase
MKKMMRVDNALVRRLSACEGMGGATSICSDKTGTLTTNKMTLVRSWVAGVASPAERDASAGDVPPAAAEVLLQSLFLNTTGAVAPPLDGAAAGAAPELSGSPTEQALLRFAAALPGAHFARLRAERPLLRVEPFSSAKKAMAVAARCPPGVTRVFWKGAAEILLASCTSQLAPSGESLPLTPGSRAQLAALIDDMAHRSLRTLALAYTDLAPGEQLSAEAGLPCANLRLLALVGMKDPCRPGVPEAWLPASARASWCGW